MISVTAYRQLPRLLGAQAFVILGLLQAAKLEGLGPVSAQWLMDNSPTFGKNMITTALRKLTSPEYQLAVRVQGGWMFNAAGAFQLPLGYALVDDKAQIENPAQRENSSQRDFGQGQVIDAAPFAAENEPELPKITDENPAQRENPSQRDFGESPVKTDSRKDSKDSLNCLDSKSQEAINRILLENAYLLIGKSVIWRAEFANQSQYDILCWLAQAFDTRANLNHPWGMVYKGLQKGRKPDPQYCDNPRRYLPREYLVKCGLEVAEPEKVADNLVDETEDDQVDDDLSAGAPIVKPVDNPKIIKAWHRVTEMLRAEMPRGAYDSWVAGCVPVVWDEQSGKLLVQPRNSCAADWLNNRLKSTVERVLYGILDRSDITVHFLEEI